MRSLRVKCLIVMSIFCGVSLSAYAEVLKCTLPSGEVVYQSQPCPAATQSKKEIKVEPQSPAQEAAALEDLKKVEAESKALDKEAEKQAGQDRQSTKQNRPQAGNYNATRQQGYRPRRPRINSHGATQTAPQAVAPKPVNTFRVP